MSSKGKNREGIICHGLGAHYRTDTVLHVIDTLSLFLGQYYKAKVILIDAHEPAQVRERDSLRGRLELCFRHVPNGLASRSHSVPALAVYSPVRCSPSVPQTPQLVNGSSIYLEDCYKY